MGLRNKDVKIIVSCFKILNSVIQIVGSRKMWCWNWNIFITERMVKKSQKRGENVSYATDPAEDEFRIRFEASALQEKQQWPWRPWTERNLTRTKSVSSQSVCLCVCVCGWKQQPLQEEWLTGWRSVWGINCPWCSPEKHKSVGVFLALCKKNILTNIWQRHISVK